MRFLVIIYNLISENSCLRPRNPHKKRVCGAYRIILPRSVFAQRSFRVRRKRVCFCTVVSPPGSCRSALFLSRRAGVRHNPFNERRRLCFRRASASLSVLCAVVRSMHRCQLHAPPSVLCSAVRSVLFLPHRAPRVGGVCAISHTDPPSA